LLHGVRLEQLILLGGAVMAGVIAYGAVVLIFRSRLPLGRFART
jgi:hypothetical protein